MVEEEKRSTCFGVKKGALEFIFWNDVLRCMTIEKRRGGCDVWKRNLG